MDFEGFRSSLSKSDPPSGLSAALVALWWDAKGDWARAHGLVDQLDSSLGMRVHAYLHRKEGDQSNAAYWYRRAGERTRHPTLNAEWNALVQAGLSFSE